MKFELLARISLALALCGGTSIAGAEDYYNSCNFTLGSNANDTMTYKWQLGDFWIPRDLPIGSPIGTPFAAYNSVDNLEGTMISCNRTPSRDPEAIEKPVFRFNMTPVGPRHAGYIAPIGGYDVTGKVWDTGIPGVGVVFQMQFPFLGPATNQLTPENSNNLAPFDSTNFYDEMPLGLVLKAITAKIVLVKTGPIEPGVHHMTERLLWKADVQSQPFSAIPNAYSAYLGSGTVRQSSCSLAAGAGGTDVSVNLGTNWTHSDFENPGAPYTTAVPFEISLLNCTDNNLPPDRFSDGWGFATAHIQLDGKNGSTVIDKDLGLFSLDSEGTAGGVGIQILHDDSRPVALNEMTSVARIASSGATQLKFKARYYKLPGAPYVSGGKASGALGFTISYR